MAATDHLSHLAQRVRHHILTATTAAQSGHPTSSLSAVELMTALFFGGHFRYDLSQPTNPFNDRILFSKGHAAPLLYALYATAGALPAEELATLRQFDSVLEGHPSMRFKYTEAPTGSLGQGLSIGVGMALAAQLDNTQTNIFVLLGDSEMSEGQVWEAIQLAAHYRLSNLIGILDCNRLGQRGETMTGHDVEKYCRQLEAFGWTALMVNGHELEQIGMAYQRALSENRPTMIVAKTVKGKGVAAWENKNGWHSKQLTAEQLPTALSALGAVDLSQTGTIAPPKRKFRPSPRLDFAQAVRESSDWHHFIQHVAQSEAQPTKKAVGEALVPLGKLSTDLVVLDAEVSNSTHTELFQKAYPNRFFEMFIAEQNMASAAIGLSRAGKLPVISSFAAFLTRSYDQIRMGQYAHTPLVVLGSYAGVSLGKDGFSQMGLEDIAFFRTLFNSIVLQPSDPVSAVQLVAHALSHAGISYIRTVRKNCPVLYAANEHFRIGGSKTLLSNADDQVTLLASGITVHQALSAAHQLAEKNIFARVLDLYSLKPLDLGALIQAATETQALITIEDHTVAGGVGEAVRTALAEHPTPIYSLAVTQEPRSGLPSELLAFEQIDAPAITALVQKIVT